MEIRTHSPFEPLWFKSTDKTGAKFDVVVVKATYDLVDERRLVIAADQAPVCPADEYYGAVGHSSVRLESDLSPFKPRNDVVVLGDAHAPGGEPAASWEARIFVGDHTAALNVHGPRRFVKDGGGWALTDAARCASVPLRYEHAFGGTITKGEETQRYAANPIGAGWMPEVPEEEPEGGWPAPQLEAFGAPVTRPDEEIAPAGFGWTGRSWQPRLSLAGTYDAAWQKERWPLSPDDFDDAFYNGASDCLIVDAPLYGEPFAAQHLSASGAVRFELPRWRVDARFRYQSGRIVTHETRLDTVVVDLPGARVLCTHRVRVPEVGPLRVLEICMREES